MSRTNVLDLLRYWKDHGEVGQQDAVRGLMVAVVAALRVEEEEISKNVLPTQVL